MLAGWDYLGPCRLVERAPGSPNCGLRSLRCTRPYWVVVLRAGLHVRLMCRVSCAESHVCRTCSPAMLESLRAFLLQSAMRLSSIGYVVTTKGRGQKERRSKSLAFPVV